MAGKHGDRFIQLGLSISHYRKIRGLTQIRLAEIVGISRTHMSNIEAPSVHKSLSLDTLFDIADALKIEPSKLLEIRD